MHPFLEKLRLSGWLALLLAAGFLASDLIAYRAASSALHGVFARGAVPAISELVYGEIQADLRHFAKAAAHGRPQAVAVAAGAGSDELVSLVNRLQSRFGCRIYFLDNAGIILLGSHAMQHVRELPGLRQVAGSVLSASATPLQSSYRDGRSTVLVNARFIPELEWYLVVEQSDEAAILPVQRAFLINLAIAAAAIGLALTSVLGMVGHYRRRLVDAAAVDSLTGLINRAAYEFVLRQTLLETDRTREPLALVLVEVDRFKRVAAAAGRGQGENILRNMAELARKSVRATDPVARWSDDRFIIQLRDCPLDKALMVAERLRQSVAAHDFDLDGRGLAVTASIGVAVHEHQEPERAFLKRTQESLAQARAKGGNRVEPEFPSAA